MKKALFLAILGAATSFFGVKGQHISNTAIIVSVFKDDMCKESLVINNINDLKEQLPSYLINSQKDTIIEQVIASVGGVNQISSLQIKWHTASLYGYWGTMIAQSVSGNKYDKVEINIIPKATYLKAPVIKVPRKYEFYWPGIAAWSVGVIAAYLIGKKIFEVKGKGING